MADTTTAVLISIAEILFQPALWWLWETVVVVCVVLAKLFKPYGKIEAVRLRNIGGKWVAGASHFASFRSTEFAVGGRNSEETHTMEPEYSPFTKMHAAGVQTPVVFYNVADTRPMRVLFLPMEHNTIEDISEEFNEKTHTHSLIIKNRILSNDEEKQLTDIELQDIQLPDGLSLNPKSNEFNTYSTRKGFLQLLRANATAAQFGILMIAVMLILGLAVGYIIYPIANPPHVTYVPIPTNGGTGH